MPKIRLFIFVVLALAFVPGLAHAQNIYLKDNANEIAQPTLPAKTVILTFDDGPSEYTPQILEILKQKQVRATFFVVGNQAVRNSYLKQIYAEGHEIGNHSFTHTDITTLPAWRTKLELNLTRLIITSQTNHSTRLLRPPFHGSDDLVMTILPALEQAGDLGYITVGETIDSGDWRRPGASNIIDTATNEEGGIILLHDGGGDRQQTIQALPEIIDYYQARDFKFSSVSEVLGLERQKIMPPLSIPERALALLTSVVLTVVMWLSYGFRWLILFLIIATFSRFLIVTTAAIMQSRRKFRYKNIEQSRCTVIIPAYNESAVIDSCLRSILASDYPDFEVLVVDDGSKDNTFEIASQVVDDKLRVMQKPNGGKASALNFGISHAATDYIIAIDADTVFNPNTLHNLMRHFSNPKVGAVSGNTKVVNRHKLITKLQSLEYIVGFNLDRRMGDLFDCITVVPGAVGAFRRSAIEDAGGFTLDTLAEDTDLTLSIKEAGHKIIYDAEAIAFTEAPATVGDLLKQRFRWTFGTMQSVWKHKRSLFNPKRRTLGLIGLPYLLLFQIIFPLFSPFFELALIVGLLADQYKLMLVSFVVYLLADLVTSAIALRLDKEKLSNLWVIIPQRIVYRQLMYYVIVRSFMNVLKGRLVHWGKLKREGSHLAKNA